MSTGSDQFLSEDDLSLQELTWEELVAEWNAWLLAASATDDEDEDEYSHGVFMRIEGRPPIAPPRRPSGMRP